MDYICVCNINLLLKYKQSDYLKYVLSHTLLEPGAILSREGDINVFYPWYYKGWVFASFSSDC